MDLTPHDILNIASRDYILQNTDTDEQMDFIRSQIKDPFDTGDANHVKRLRQLIQGEELDNACENLLRNIEDRYPSLDFDLSGLDQSIESVFTPSYKFFVKNIQSLTYKFLHEYISSAKNRKMLVAEYLNIKLPSYPKEQYGKKEFYILFNKLPCIIKDIAKDSTLRLEEFIYYIERARSGGESPMYVEETKRLVKSGIICDHGVVQDIFELFIDSDQYDRTICKLQMDITTDIIVPYLEDNGLMQLRLPTVTPIEPEDDDDENEDESDDQDTAS